MKSRKYSDASFAGASSVPTDTSEVTQQYHVSCRSSKVSDESAMKILTKHKPSALDPFAECYTTHAVAILRYSLSKPFDIFDLVSIIHYSHSPITCRWLACNEILLHLFSNISALKECCPASISHKSDAVVDNLYPQAKPRRPCY